MKPVDQTLFGWPHGNCHSACLASIFEVPLDSVPHDLGSRPDWRQAVDAFLSSLGYRTTPFSFNRNSLWKPEWSGYCTMVGISPRKLDPSVASRERMHAVVGLNGNIVHDPHPSRYGLRGDDWDVWIYKVKAP
jgi:hypothetical protein